MSTTARRTIRLAVMSALASLTGTLVESPGDWDVPGAKLPVIKVRPSAGRKAATGRTLPEFNTTVSIDLQVVCSGSTGAAAQDALEALLGQVEDLVYGSPALVSQIQQIATVSSQPFYSADGETHLAGESITLEFELFEAFDPVEIAPSNYPALQQLAVTVDSSNVFDPTGTYANPPFPAAVQPAPRTQGPDGRAEAGALVELPQ